MLIPRLARRLLLGLLLIALALGGAAGLIGWRTMVRSLPLLDGEAAVTGLSAPVRVDRDSLGVPTIQAADRRDAMCALGFVHAQDRFFQMDTMRRYAAGEMAALIGPPGIEPDRRMRTLLLRERAEEALAALPAEHRAIVEAYAAGVNAGLASLGARPPEYLALRARPAPWTPEDSLLVAFAMFDMLNFSQSSERRKNVMDAALEPELVAFLTPATTRWDVPLIGESDYTPAPPPGPEIVDLRRRSAADDSLALDADLVAPEQPWRTALGSNGWAVAARRSRSGGAILANDMHLGLQAPNLWYRAQIERPERRVVGATLPGAPTIIVGSNGDIAWGFTNVTGDFQDLVRIEVVGGEGDRYVASDSPRRIEAFEIRTETIEVRGGADIEHEIRLTRWGPVVGEDPLARPLALAWTALLPGGINLDLIDMMDAASLEEAMVVMEEWRGPPQNTMIAARDGRIAWIVSGMLPKRVGFDGSVSMNWTAEGVGWDGALDPLLRPMRADPESGALFTANARTAPIEVARRISAEWAPPFRAARIAELLENGDSFDERDMLDMQLDTRTAILDFYRDRVLEITGGAASESPPDLSPELRLARRLAAQWSGRATRGERGHRLLRAYRSALHEMIFGPLVAPCLELDASFQYQWTGSEEPLRRILEERPPHLLAPAHDSWDDLLRTSLEAAMANMKESRPELEIDAPWGRFNRVTVRHPVSRAVGALGWLLDMPTAELPGDVHAVRVSHPRFGASQRLVVSPGREEDGLWHMPAGQSGHPLSEHYADGHQTWVEGQPAPLLAGEPLHTLRLLPDGAE